MNSIPLLKDIIAEMLPLHRTLVSDGTDEALKIIGKYMPSTSDYDIETFAPLKKVWTWKVPERYVVHEAFLETEDGERILDFKDNPLHLVSYSLSIDKVLDWQELESHLYYSEKRPSAVPWMFKFYERDWGFCLSKDLFDKLPRDAKYHAVIHSEFLTDPKLGLKIGTGVIHPEGGKKSECGEFIICAHICHPSQANDDLAGVVSAIEIANRLANEPLPKGSISVRFLFCPETIGSISYLSHHEDFIPHFRAGIFSEMTGNKNSLILQRSRQDTHLVDRISQYVLSSKANDFRQGAFREVVGNDEMVINGPGVNVPCISLSRWPYDEYHTSADNLDIIHEDLLLEAADVMEEIVRIFCTNYIPRRLFRGPIFLSGHGLWVDWRTNMELNRALEKIMLKLDGDHSIFDIASELSLDYWLIRDYIEKFLDKALVEKICIPSEAHDK